MKCESGRYTRPVTPVTSRLCKYCSINSIDDEKHAILECNTFLIKRNCFFGKLISLLPNFDQMSLEHKLLTILCPANADIALCVSKYLKIISETRTKLDQGLSNYMLLDYCKIWCTEYGILFPWIVRWIKGSHLGTLCNISAKGTQKKIQSMDTKRSHLDTKKIPFGTNKKILQRDKKDPMIWSIYSYMHALLVCFVIVT